MSIDVAATLPSAEDLHALLDQVWESFVDTQPLLPAAPANAPAWSTSVSVDGAWRGTIALYLSDVGARAIANAMLANARPGAIETAPEPPTEEDLLDAIGELANILGGNLKSLMPEPSQLSLPVVVRQPALPADHGPELSCRLDLSWQGETITAHVQLTDLPEEQHPA
ncbi:chemotaxis protein CheX [Nocardioides sp. Bht2]|uniref:chemotaxis protein CheX n=1 Tax=Nocardioides sp. Bht2 TaxID=3392297 RepID=UPI0039B65B82